MKGWLRLLSVQVSVLKMNGYKSICRFSFREVHLNLTHWHLVKLFLQRVVLQQEIKPSGRKWHRIRFSSFLSLLGVHHSDHFQHSSCKRWHTQPSELLKIISCILTFKIIPFLNVPADLPSAGACKHSLICKFCSRLNDYWPVWL